MTNPAIAMETGRRISEMFEREEKFYQEFLEKGVEYTEGYLSSFGKVRSFLAKHHIWGDVSKYNGARRALEDMAKDS
jgi:hypothetical protein